jgi:hypothetical protein
LQKEQLNYYFAERISLYLHLVWEANAGGQRNNKNRRKPLRIIDEKDQKIPEKQTFQTATS